MGNTVKNIAMILGLVTVAYAGYFAYVQKDSLFLDTQNDAALQEMLVNTSVFIERSRELDRMSIDTALFADERFRSLRSFSEPLEEKPVGRPNPFATVDTDVVSTISTVE